MKKLISTVLTIIMVYLMIPGVAASENTLAANQNSDYIFEPEPTLSHEEIVAFLENSPNTQQSSEYDVILQEKNRAKNILASNSATPSEQFNAKIILSFDPTKKVYQLQKKTDQELREMGMNTERIHLIRNFKGTDAEMQALSAVCSVSGNPKYTKNASGQWAKITFAFSWNKAPFWQKRDALVAQATTGFLPDKVPDVKCNINYISPNGTPSYEYFDSSDLKQKSFQAGNPAGFAFPVWEERIAGVSRAWCYPQSGMATIVFRSKDTHQVQLSYGYAHARRDISANIGIQFSGTSPTGSLNFCLSNQYYEMLPAPTGGKLCNSHFF